MVKSHRPSLTMSVAGWLTVASLGTLGNAQTPVAPAPAAPGAGQSYVTSWLGNSFGGASGWVQLGAQGMFTAPDGSVYLNTYWDEGTHEAAIYKEGAMVGAFDHTHGWGYSGGEAVTANDRYVYVAQTMSNEGGGLVDEHTWPVKGREWIGLTRRLRGTRLPAPFAGGKGGTKGDTLKDVFLVVDDLPEDAQGTVTGLAVTSDRLYVSDSATNQIRVYDAETMVLTATWPCPNPGQLALDRDGNLWVIEAATVSAGTPDKASIVSFTPDGKSRPQAITGADTPSGLAFDAAGQLLVADNGPDEQVKIFDHLDGAPQLAGALGAKGGVFAPPVPGRTGPLRFNGPIGVGADSAGNIYVCCGADGTVLESYSPDGHLRWHLEGLTFVDSGQIDAANGRDFFTGTKRFVLNYGALQGPIGEYAGFTVDRFRYPGDPRAHSYAQAAGTTWVREIGGKRFLFKTTMYADQLAIYALNEQDEIARPSGFFAEHHIAGDWLPGQPAQGRWIWRDANGNGAFEASEYQADSVDDPALWGWCVDSRGDVWQAYLDQLKIVHFHCEGLDAQGNPIYSRANATMVDAPAPFNQTGICQLHRLEYSPSDDAMYLSGFTADYPNHHGNWGTPGPIICRFDHWSTHPVLRWQITTPYDVLAEHSKTYGTSHSLAVAGRYLFVGYLISAEIHVFDTSTGDPVTILRPGPEVGGKSGWIDLAYGISAFERPDGEYVIAAEDDLYAKQILYRWRPGSTAKPDDVR